MRVRCVAVGEGTAKTWYLHLRSSDALRLRFDLASEILACVAPEGKVQVGAIHEAEAELAQPNELDCAVVLFVSSDADAEHRLAPVLPTERSYMLQLPADQEPLS